TGPQQIHARLGAADIRIPTGTSVHVASFSVDVRHDPQARYVGFRARAEAVRLGTKAPQIDAEIPLIETSLSGQITAELIPRRFAGDASLRVSDAASGTARLGTEAPLRVSGDLWKGLFELPDQQTVFQESV